MWTKIILSCLTLASFLDISAPAYAAAKIIQDQCNQTSGDGMGHSCPGIDMLLIRPEYEDGTCWDWMCCPVNSDGKAFDCSRAERPTSRNFGIPQGFLGPEGDTLIVPSTGPTIGRPPTFQGTRTQIVWHGLEGALPDSEPPVTKENTPAPK